MSLFVRVQTSFWTNRKTVRLRAKLGDAALWIPPRLWCYAAENQPDGDFSGYSAEELAMLIGYTGDAQAMLQALQQASLMDDMKIHDWNEHNSYHVTYSERAKTAAKARWKKEKTGQDKKGEEKIGQDKTRKETSIACSNACSMEASFKVFWAAYPRRQAKGNAEKAWAKQKCAPILSQILTAIEAAKLSESWVKDHGRFIPHPATWLNQKGWEDEHVPFRKNGHGISENLKVRVWEPE